MTLFGFTLLFRRHCGEHVREIERTLRDVEREAAKGVPRAAQVLAMQPPE